VEYKDYEIEIVQDTDPMSPRDDENFGTMACFHRRYRLGDNPGLSIEDAQELSKSKDVLFLPLFLYYHSGITMNTCGFSCP